MTRRQLTSKSCLMVTPLLKTTRGLSDEVNRPKYLASRRLTKLTHRASCFGNALLPTLEAHMQHRLSLAEGQGQEITSAHLRGFRFHSSVRRLVKQGYYAIACQLSMLRTIKEIRQFSPTLTELTAFAARQCNVIVGMDKYGDKYINAFDELNPRSDSYRVIADQLIQDHTLPDTLFRRIRHSAPGGVHIAKAFISPTEKFELFIDRMHTVYLRHAHGQLTQIDTLAHLFKSANICLSGRFVALITAEGKVQRYDRATGQSQLVALSGDLEAVTISVANDGTLYIGSRENTYIAPVHGSVVKKGPGLDRYSQIFSLSADERFLIFQRKSIRGVDLLLKDLKNNHREIILSQTSDKAHSYTNTPCSIAFSPFNAMAAVGYKNGVVEIFDLTQDRPHAKLLARVSVPKHHVAPCPIVSFSQGFNQVHIVYRGRGNIIELSMLTLGAPSTSLYADKLLSSKKLFTDSHKSTRHIAFVH